MASESTAQNLQFAALAIPVLALVMSVAIDSVNQDDSAAYRGFVGGIGVLTLGTTMTVIILGIFSSIIPIKPVEVVRSLIYTSVLVGVLSIVVIIKESLREIENDDKELLTVQYMAGIAIVGGILLMFLP
jgi:hypothetical protein